MVAFPLLCFPLPGIPPPARSSSSFLRWHAALGVSLAVGAGLGLAIAPQLSAHRVAWMRKAFSIHKNRSRLLGCAMAPFACLSLVAEAPPIDKEVVEPQTQVSFPVLLDERKQLAGIGLRKKNILGLKSIIVYAFGIYADEGSLREKLGSKHAQQAVTELKEIKEFYEDVIATDSSLTVRLVIVYGRLKIGSVRSAFEESIGNRIKKFSGTENKQLLESFTGIFKDEFKLPCGTTIDITRHPGYVLRTKLDGNEIGSVQSPLLCRALFDLYIGEEPFDKKGKEEIGLGLASLLATS